VQIQPVINPLLCPVAKISIGAVGRALRVQVTEICQCETLNLRHAAEDGISKRPILLFPSSSAPATGLRLTG